MTFALLSVSSARAFTIYTDRTAWQNAVTAPPGNTITTDTFSTNIPAAQTITLTSGIVSANSLPPPVGVEFNTVSGGNYVNATDGDASEGSAAITWTFPGPTFAFGANFSLVNPNSLTLSGNFDGTGNQTLVVYNSLNASSGFLGIIGNANFNSIVFGNASTVLDIFIVDNASFAVGIPPAAVPEPGTVVGLTFVAGSFLLGRLGKRE
ncbi:hypothetical protein [Pannus brasiliensis]|uniref:hypothetical protein n=1 Tax=Pannus brasiliensis TaxID=1579216 RepID=UPI002FCD99F5